MKKVVGIDLGTTNSAIAIMEGGKAHILKNEEGDSTTPSVVSYDKSKEEFFVGKTAKNQASSNPRKTIGSVKRIIGLQVKDIPEGAKRVNYDIAGRPNDFAQVLLPFDEPEGIMPHNISANVLKKLKTDAEKKLEHAIEDVVITVPAYFNDSQRKATQLAGKLAGLNVLRIINEPTAAALAYGFKTSDTDDEKKIAVFDLGGGTFDISILEIGSGVFTVKSTNGDTFLGGDDFDKEIVNLLIKYLINNTGTDFRDNPVVMQRLKEAAVSAKHSLSDNEEVIIKQAFLSGEGENAIHLEFPFTREKFEKLIQKYLKKIEICCKDAISQAGLSNKDIEAAVLVGGSTRIPAVKQLVEKIFGKVPDTSINPDEAVALGAAIQGAIISGEKKDTILVDVTPLSLGIETEHGIMDVLIPRNTTIPCSIKQEYTTTSDGQSEVEVVVYQGENKRVKNNRFLNKFILEGIEPDYAGEPRIEVKFAIDANGVVQVNAKDAATGLEQSVVIQNASDMSEEEFLKLQQIQEDDNEVDYEEYDDEYEEELDLAELLTVADTLIKQTDEGLGEFKDSLSEAAINHINVAKNNLLAAIQSQRVDDLDEYVTNLMSLWDNYTLDE